MSCADDSLNKLAAEFRELYEKYSAAIEKKDFDEAIRVGIKILEDLLKVAESVVLRSLMNPRVREVAVSIIGHHERALAYVKGAKEAVEGAPLEFSQRAKEKATETLSASINSLFGFLLGILVVFTDLELSVMPTEGGHSRRSLNDVPRVI